MPSVVTTCSINMYADDTALYASDTETTVAAKKVTEDLSAITKWCTDNYLRINQSKTYAMFLSRKNKKQSAERRHANILLNGSPLQTVHEFRYLGVLLDDELTFKNHIKSIWSTEFTAEIATIPTTHNSKTSLQSASATTPGILPICMGPEF